MQDQLCVRYSGLEDYLETWQAMKKYVDQRTDQSKDELWVLEHPRVFTLGQAAKREHLLAPGDIPIVQSDRGGQVTYHGPGQVVIYLMLDLKRKKLGPKGLVRSIEGAIIRLLAGKGIDAATRSGAPGVYVANKKIASLGLRIRKGYSYHGLSLNVEMDLEPFTRINPCGILDLEVTQLADLGVTTKKKEIARELVRELALDLTYLDLTEGELNLSNSSMANSDGR